MYRHRSPNQKNIPFYKDPALYLVFGMILLTVLVFQLLKADELTAPEIHHFVAPPLTAKKTYKAEFGDRSHIYDGDTLIDMYVRVKTFEKKDYPAEILWPGILLVEDTPYVITDIRLKGIDTPEMHPATAGRTPESLEREKAAAEEAKEAVEQLLQENDYEFVLTEPQMGKYAGRTVADVLIGKDRINLSEFLINKGLGYRYDGKTKRKFDDWFSVPSTL